MTRLRTEELPGSARLRAQMVSLQAELTRVAGAVGEVSRLRADLDATRAELRQARSAVNWLTRHLTAFVDALSRTGYPMPPNTDTTGDHP